MVSSSSSKPLGWDMSLEVLVRVFLGVAVGGWPGGVRPPAQPGRVRLAYGDGRVNYLRGVGELATVAG